MAVRTGVESDDGNGRYTAERAAAVGHERCAEGGKWVRLVRCGDGEVRGVDAVGEA